MGNEHSGDRVPGAGGRRGKPRRSSLGSGTIAVPEHSSSATSSPLPDPLAKPVMRRAATMGPSTSITISPPPPDAAQLEPPPNLRQDSAASDSSIDSTSTSPFNLPPPMQKPATSTKRGQFLTIDFLPASTSVSGSPQSHPSSAPSSLIVSPLSSAASSGSGLSSSISSLSIPMAAMSSSSASASAAGSSWASSAASSSSSSPKISAMLREHPFGRSAYAQPQPQHPHQFSPRSPTSSLFPHSPPPLTSCLSEPVSRKRATVETLVVHTHYNAAGQKQINQYVVEGGEIGRGSYGTVKLVYSVEDQNYYAMKVMNKSLLKKRRVMGYTAGIARTASLGGINASPKMLPLPSGASRVSVASSALPAAGAPSDHWANVQREIAIMKKLSHENVVRLIEVMDDPSTDNLYLVMEYMSHGSVMSGEIDQLAALPLDRCWSYFRDVLRGLDYLHFNNVAHRDLKPENLLLSGTGHLKISDFGVSMLFEGGDDRIQSGSTTVGSAAFLAPELCGGGLGTGGATSGSGSGGIARITAPPSPATPATPVSSRSPAALSPAPSPKRPTLALLQALAAQGQSQEAFGVDGRSFSMPVGVTPPPSRPQQRVTSFDTSSPPEVSGKKGDIWSLGVTLYVFLFGALPFMAKTVALMYRAIVEDDLTLPPADDARRNPNHISAETHPELVDLLHRMLDKNPNTRISMAEMKIHPWVTRGDTVPMEDQPEETTAARRASAAHARKTSISAQRRAAARERAAARRAARCAARPELEATDEAAETELTDTDTDGVEEEDEDGEGAIDDDDATADGAPTRSASASATSSNYQPISLTSEDMLGAVTLVSRVILVVKLKTKMRRRRLQLAAARARSLSVGDAGPAAALARKRPGQQRTSPPRGAVGASATTVTIESPVSASTTTVECLSPSMSATEHISVPVDLEHARAASSSSKRHALARGGTQALLTAARGAISAGTSGDRAAATWAPPPDSDSDVGPGFSILNIGPASPLRPGQQHRMPQFPHRKGSLQASDAELDTDTHSTPNIADSPAPPALEPRHQSAPLREPPFYYVPYSTYVQQSHSLSCSNLEEDEVRARAAATERLMRADAHARPNMQRYEESDDDDSDLDEAIGAVQVTDQELDI